MTWQIGLVANTLIAVAYFAISAAIIRPLARTGQLRCLRSDSRLHPFIGKQNMQPMPRNQSSLGKIKHTADRLQPVKEGSKAGFSRNLIQFSE